MIFKISLNFEGGAGGLRSPLRVNLALLPAPIRRVPSTNPLPGGSSATRQGVSFLGFGVNVICFVPGVSENAPFGPSWTPRDNSPSHHQLAAEEVPTAKRLLADGWNHAANERGSTPLSHYFFGNVTSPDGFFCFSALT
jgi:hypothetical protein